jgi:hypothetical protein
LLLLDNRNNSDYSPDNTTYNTADYTAYHSANYHRYYSGFG